MVVEDSDSLNKESDITYIYIDIDQHSPDVQKSIAEIQSGLEKYKNDEVMLEYLTSALDNILDYSAGWGKI